MSVTLTGVRIMGIACSVPEISRSVHEVAERFGVEETARIAESIGVQSRHIAPGEICTSDLCQAAAGKLMADLGWERESIGAIVFVTQSADYRLPATACLLQSRMGLPTTCAAFDVNLGCSGYIYGLWMLGALVKTGIRRALLLAGDTSSRGSSPLDRSVALLFGDAGSATAVEADPDAPPVTFELGTDGAGGEFLIVPAGGWRMPANERTKIPTEREGGNIRSDEDLYLNGAEVFSFTLARVPKMVNVALKTAGWTMDNVDYVVFHQANRFMLEHIAKRMKIPAGKFIIEMEQWGNTSSASIPLAIVASHVGGELRTAAKNLLLAGFGVGWSWGAMTVSCGPMVVPDVVFHGAGNAEEAEVLHA